MLPRKRLDRKLQGHESPFWLDEGAVYFITINCQQRGVNQLCEVGICDGLIGAWKFYAGQGRCSVELILVMPDHVHLLASFDCSKKSGMTRVVNDWKRYTSRKFGVNWQRDYFDHRIRSEDSLEQKWDYILNNRYSAMLVSDGQKWPYQWVRE